MESKPNVGVVIAEPESNLLNRLSVLCSKVWHEGEVLPRRSNVELKNAAKWLDTEVIIARLSVLQTCHTFAECVSQMMERGAQLVCIQDSATPLSPSGSVSFGDCHFVSDQTRHEVLLELLINCRLKAISLGRFTHS